jgi:hypothetical protein
VLLEGTIAVGPVGPDVGAEVLFAGNGGKDERTLEELLPPLGTVTVKMENGGEISGIVTFGLCEEVGGDEFDVVVGTVLEKLAKDDRVMALGTDEDELDGRLARLRKIGVVVSELTPS